MADGHMSHRAFQRAEEGQSVKELIRTNDPVLVSYLVHRLEEAGIEPFQMDMHMSLMEGSLGILPKRIMVVDDDYDDARKILDEVKRGEER